MINPLLRMINHNINKHTIDVNNLNFHYKFFADLTEIGQTTKNCCSIMKFFSLIKLFFVVCILKTAESRKCYGCPGYIKSWSISSSGERIKVQPMCKIQKFIEILKVQWTKIFFLFSWQLIRNETARLVGSTKKMIIF